jgi:hypothetical protein
MMKRSRIKLVATLFAILLTGAALAIAIRYTGGVTGTAVRQDSPLPTDTPEPPTDTPTPTPTPTPTSTIISTYKIHFEVKWHDAPGNLSDAPPVNLSAVFSITAQSGLGIAMCTYPTSSLDLACQYSNQEPAPDDAGLWVPSMDAYTVDQTGLPEGWQSFAGIGVFRAGGPSPSFIHVVHNLAPGAPPPEPTFIAVQITPASPEATSTPKPPKPLPPKVTPTPKTPTPTPTPTPEVPTPTPSPTPLEATSTPEPPTATPRQATSTPEPPTATPTPTSTPEPPTQTPTPTPLEALPVAKPPTATPTPRPPSPTPAAAAQVGAESAPTPTAEATPAQRDQLGVLMFLGTGLVVGGLALCLVGLLIVVIARRKSTVS